jgi:hypothetical protein
VEVVGVTALTDVQTRFVGITALTEVQVGSVVNIRGITQADGSFLARELRAAPVALSGTLTAVSTDTPPAITVLGRSIALAADTEIVQITAPPRGGDHGGGPGGPRGGEFSRR